MKTGSTWWHNGHKYLTQSQAVLGIAGSLISGSLKVDASKLTGHPLLSALLLTVQESAWFVLPVIAIWLYAAQWIKRHLGSPFYVWDMIKFLLDELRGEVFPDPEQAGHHDRVTLFQHKRFALHRRLFKGIGWLIPVERSGYLTRRSKACFYAPDDGDGAEGIAGQTWANNKSVHCDDLPRIDNYSSVEEIREYAQRTFCPEKDIRKNAMACKGGPLPRSLCGIPVEVKGKMWGVIVIDSRNPTLMDKAKIYKFYERNARFLNKLLEKV